MSKETILKIREAEETAAQIVAKAEAEASERKAQAVAQGKQSCAESEVKTRRELDAMLEEIRQRTEEVTAKILQEGKNEADRFGEAFRLGKRQAEEIILGRLEAKCR